MISTNALKELEPDRPEVLPVAFPRVSRGPRFGPAAAPPDESGADPRTLLNRLKYHWLLCLTAGTVLATTAALSVWYFFPAKYATYSLLRVSSTSLNPIQPDNGSFGRTEFATYLKTQAQLLKSNFVVAAALRDPRIAGLETIRKHEEGGREGAVHWLAEELKVEFQSESQILKISLEGENPGDLAAIVNAVMAAYLKEVIDREQQGKRDILKMLEDSKQDMEKLLATQKETVRKLTADIGEPEGTSVKDRLAFLARVEEELLKVNADRAAIAKHLEVLEAKRQQIEKDDVPSDDWAEFLQKDLKATHLNAQVEKAKQKVEYMRGLVQDSNNPMFQGLVSHLAERKKEHEEHLSKVKAEYVKGKRAKQQEEWKKAIDQKTLEQAALDEKATRIQQYKVTLTTPAKKPATSPDAGIKPGDPTTDPSIAMRDIEQRELMAKQIGRQVQLLRLELQSPARVEPLQEAIVPVRKEVRKQVLMSAFAALAGLGLILGLVSLFEARVGRAFTARELATRAGLALVGTVPEASFGRGGARATVRPKDRLSHEAFAEAIDRVRVSAFPTDGDGSPQTVLVTSADRREGKTLLAGHLALSLVKTGKKVLLVDADLRNPALHRTLELPEAPGLCELLRAETGLAEAVHRTPVNGLFFLPAGRWDADARDELGKDKLKKLFDKLKQEFDFLLVDSHALLEATDSLLIAEYADAIFLTALRCRSRAADVEQSRQRLAGVGKTDVGLVFMGE